MRHEGNHSINVVGFGVEGGLARSAQRKAAPCPRIEGDSMRSGDVQVWDVYKEGSGVLASEQERERTKVSECAVHSSHEQSNRFITRHEDIQ